MSETKPTQAEIAAKYSPYAPFLRKRPSNALAPAACVLCGSPTSEVADGATPDGKDHAHFVPVCDNCVPTPAPAPAE